MTVTEGLDMYCYKDCVIRRVDYGKEFSLWF